MLWVLIFLFLGGVQYVSSDADLSSLEKVTVRIVDDGGHSYAFKLKKTSPFGKVYQAFHKKTDSTYPDHCLFHFDDIPVLDSMTPLTLHEQAPNFSDGVAFSLNCQRPEEESQHRTQTSSYEDSSLLSDFVALFRLDTQGLGVSEGRCELLLDPGDGKKLSVRRDSLRGGTLEDIADILELRCRSGAEGNIGAPGLVGNACMRTVSEGEVIIRCSPTEPPTYSTTAGAASPNTQLIFRKQSDASGYPPHPSLASYADGLAHPDVPFNENIARSMGLTCEGKCGNRPPVANDASSTPRKESRIMYPTLNNGRAVPEISSWFSEEELQSHVTQLYTLRQSENTSSGSMGFLFGFLGQYWAAARDYFCTSWLPSTTAGTVAVGFVFLDVHLPILWGMAWQRSGTVSQSGSSNASLRSIRLPAGITRDRIQNTLFWGHPVALLDICFGLVALIWLTLLLVARGDN
eukprot:Rmarinus@m.27313